MPTISFRNSNLVSDLCIQPLMPCYIAPMNGTQTWMMVCLILQCFWISWPEIADMDSEHVRTLTNKMADLLYINH
jgi:hypothetical protein